MMAWIGYGIMRPRIKSGATGWVRTARAKPDKSDFFTAAFPRATNAGAGAGPLQRRVMGCHVLSWSGAKSAFPGGWRGRWSGQVGAWRLLGSARVHSAHRPAMERPFIARICVRARARVGAGAVRAPDCPRARQAEGALRLSAEPKSIRMRVGAGRLQPVMECHIYSHFVMVAAAKGFLAGGEGEGRVDDGHGRGSFVPARVRRGRRRGFADRPPRHRSDPLPRARQAQDTLRLSAESGP